MRLFHSDLLVTHLSFSTFNGWPLDYWRLSLPPLRISGKQLHALVEVLERFLSVLRLFGDEFRPFNLLLLALLLGLSLFG